MENGMKRVVGLEMSEKGHVENEVLGDKVESGVVVDSGDTRDMEEEVFEEATDSQEQFQEVGAESELGANFETVEDSNLELALSNKIRSSSSLFWRLLTSN